MKRLIDIIGALVGLILLWPVILVVAVLIAWKMGRPVLFRQIRTGLGGCSFTMVKFRTMRDSHDARGASLPDADRLTRLGTILRATSIDELPTMWNVLLGDMSLVGPRPLLTDYLSLYSFEEARRNDVRPGITGWAQVNGRNALDWDEKLALDVWYVDNQSLWLDVRILAMTIITVIRRDGISAEGEATMPRYEGRN